MMMGFGAVAFISQTLKSKLINIEGEKKEQLEVEGKHPIKHIL